MQAEHRILVGGLPGVAQVQSAERMANALVLAETACIDAGCPLNEVQRIALLGAALQSFDGLDRELERASWTMAALDVTLDPRFDSSVCLNCGGLIGCEYCPSHRSVLNEGR